MRERDLTEKVKTWLREMGYPDSTLVQEFQIGEDMRPDLIVMDDTKRPLIVVEVKARLQMPLAERQLEQYLRKSKARYGMLTDGDRRVFYAMLDSGEMVEIPEIPGPGKDLGDIHLDHLKPLESPSYKFRSISDILRREGLPYDLQLREFQKLLLCKIVDETQHTFTGLFWPPNALSLSETEGEQIKTRFRDAFQKAKEAYPDLFKHNETIELSNRAIANIAHQLASYSIRKDPDSFARGFEDLLLHDARHMAQHLTSRILVRFLVEMIRPTIEETVIDPACGTGGLLLGVVDHVRLRYSNVSLFDYARRNLYGVDINERVVSIAKMNMILHGLPHSNIYLCDSLVSLPDQVSRILARGGFDVVVVDPPLGGFTPVTKGSKQEKERRTRHTSILFIERAIELAKIHGRIGVIVPENVLFEGGDMQSARSFILEKTYVRAIVSLPIGSYLPFSSVKTSALVLEKKDPSQGHPDYNVFIAEANTEESLAEIASKFNEELLLEVASKFKEAFSL